MANISVNPNVRERASAERRANLERGCCSEHIATRGRRLP